MKKGGFQQQYRFCTIFHWQLDTDDLLLHFSNGFSRNRIDYIHKKEWTRSDRIHPLILQAQDLPDQYPAFQFY